MSTETTTFRSAASRIPLEEQPTDLNCSPKESLLAVGHLNGNLCLYSFEPEKQHFEDLDSNSEPDTQFEHEITEAALLKPSLYYKSQLLARTGSRKSCSVRSILFSIDGNALTVAYSNGSLYSFDSSTLKKIRSIKSGHDCEIYRIENVDNHRTASGDDTGLIKIWDERSSNRIGEIQAHVDYITDLAYLPGSYELVAASGDTSVTINDLRKFSTVMESHDGFKEEPTALQPLAKGNHIVCGTSKGKIAIFCPLSLNKSHEWFTGGARIHNGSVDAMISLDDQTIITGCADGAIRALRFDPNRLLGIVGRHKDPDTIERLAISHDDTVLASIGIENCIRLWDIQNIRILADQRCEDIDRDRSDTNDGTTKRPMTTMSNKAKKKLKKKQTIPNFFSDLT